LTIKAFSHAWENIQFIRDDTPFSGWITSITIHAFLSYMLTSKLEGNDKNKLTFPKTYVRSRLEENIFNLPPRERYIAVFYFIEKYSLEETSDFLGLTYTETAAIIENIKETLLDLMDHVYDEQQLVDKMESLPDRISPAPSVWTEIDSKIMNEKIVIAEKKEEEQARELASAEPVQQDDIVTETGKKENVKKELPAINFNRFLKKKSIKITLRILAGVIIAAVIYYFVLYDKNIWTINNISGNVSIGDKPVKQGAVLREEETVTGNSGSYFSLDIPAIGKVQSSGISEMKCVSDSQLTFSLGNFKIDKRKASSGFTAEVPSAVVKDLSPGGYYDLIISPGNNSIIENKENWIIVSSNLVEFYVPPQYICEIKAAGPVIPYHQNAPAQFKELLRGLNAEGANKEEIAAMLTAMAQESDFISLWNMIRLVTPMSRGQIFDRVASKIQMPASIPREGIIFLDEKKLEALRVLLAAVSK
jgi:hypothetical protein